MAIRPLPLAAAAWLSVLGVGALVGTQFWLYPFVYDRVTHSGESAVPSFLWLIMDFLAPFWIFTTHLGFIAVGVAAWATWRILRRPDVIPSKSARIFFASAAVAATLGSIALAALVLPSAFVFVTRPAMCRTTTFSEAMSPNGRYKAVVAEVDCGGMSSAHRQVFVIRHPFSWAPTSLLYFNEQPELQLSWRGRTLTVRGDRVLHTMKHPPPDPMLWAGILARYQGPMESDLRIGGPQVPNNRLERAGSAPAAQPGR